MDLMVLAASGAHRGGVTFGAQGIGIVYHERTPMSRSARQGAAHGMGGMG
jgi:hypothetical protein